MEANIRIVNKKVGQTPLECINELKKNEPALVHVPLTYAGRLDPLAKGVLLILVGDECHKKDEYLKLSKEYEVTILFGFVTDTYDVMGKVENSPKDQAESKVVFETIWPSFQKNLERRFEDLSNTTFDEAILKKFTGRVKQSYPPYSSRTVKGKPLFMWAREGKIKDIIIPSREVLIESIEMIKEGKIKGSKLLNKIKSDISQVKGDFRQNEILDIWQDVLADKKEEEFKTITLKVCCGSGVYVRGIAHELGLSIGVSSLALEIVRTRVGDYKIINNYELNN